MKVRLIFYPSGRPKISSENFVIMVCTISSTTFRFTFRGLFVRVDVEGHSGEVYFGLTETHNISYTLFFVTSLIL